MNNVHGVTVILLCTLSDGGLYLYKIFMKMLLAVFKPQSGHECHKKIFGGP